MNGSPPVKPISRVPSPWAGDLVVEGGGLGPRDVDEPVVAGARFDVAVPAGDVAERAGVDPERLQASAPRWRGARALRSSPGPRISPAHVVAAS